MSGPPLNRAIGGPPQGGDGLPPPLAAATMQLVLHQAGAGGAEAIAHYAASKDNPIVSSLGFVDVAAGLTPATFLIPAAPLMGLVVQLSKVEDTPGARAAFAAANLLEYGLSEAAMARVLFEYAKAGLFSQRFEDEVKFWEAADVVASTMHDNSDVALVAADSVSVLPIAVGGAPPQVAARGGRGRRGRGGRGQAAQPQPQQPAVPAPASTAELRWLTRVRWGAFKSDDGVFPLATLGRALRLLGDSGTQAVRDDDMSELRTSVAILRGSLERLFPSATEAVLASRLPQFISSSTLPSVMSSPSGMHAALADDIIVGDRYNMASRTIQEVIEAQRINLLARHFSTVGSIVATFCAPIDAANALQQLGAQLAPHVKGSLVVLMSELERVLHPQDSVIQQIIRNNPGRAGAAVVDLLLRELEMTSSRSDSRGGGGGGGAADGNFDAGTPADFPTASELRLRSLQECLHTDNFRALHMKAESENLEGIELLAAGFDSGCPIVVRFICRREAWLGKCHILFHKLGLARPHLLQYFSRMLTVDENTDEVPDQLQSYEWEASQMKLLLDGRWDELELVNKQGGYLAIKELRTLRRWNDVPEEEKYALPATLKEASKHFHRLTCALGFDPDPASGYSAKATFSKLIEYIEFGDSLPDGAQPEWNRFGVAAFRSAMRRMGSRFIGRILANQPSEDLHPEVRLTDVLSSNDPLFELLARRIEKSETLTTVMQAIPGLVGAQAPRTVLGASAPSFSGKKRVTFDEDDAAGGESEKKQRAAANKKKGPGSQFGHGKLASWIEENKTLFHVQRVVDVRKLADKLGVDVSSKCWPVLLSSKQGAAKLEFCCNPKAHGGIHSAAHKAPDKMNKKTINECCKTASAAILNQQGWSGKSGAGSI